LILTNPYAATYSVAPAVQHAHPSEVPQAAPQGTPQPAPEPVQAPAASPVVQHQTIEPKVIENPYFQNPSSLVNSEVH
jgi:hypothetical protein